MLEDLNNIDLIEHVNEDPDADAAAVELAMRLGYAIDELNRLCHALDKMEALHGNNNP